MLPVQPPVKPMLASPVDGIPRKGGLLFEPKWDGFRCLVFADPQAEEPVVLQSRTGRPLNRYFPEVLRNVAAQLDRPAVLDGELVVIRRDDAGDRLDWDALTERIHPAASRVRTLAERTPATFIAFDLLALDERDLTGAPAMPPHPGQLSGSIIFSGTSSVVLDSTTSPAGRLPLSTASSHS